MKFRFLLSLCWIGLSGAGPSANPALHLISSTGLPGISGDLDHLAIDTTGNRLFVAAEDNGTLRVIDLKSGKLERTVKGFQTPHSILYLPAARELFVTDGSKSVQVLDSATFTVKRTIATMPGADSIGVDSSRGRLFTVTGGKDVSMTSSAITEIDTKSAKLLGQIPNEEWLGAFGEIGQSNDTSELTSQEHKVFRAVGKAHLRTNLPIFTHNAYGTGANVPKNAGLVQLDVLESVGVKPQHVAIGHMDSLDDPTAEIIKQIAKRGAFVGFDRVTSQRPPDDQRVTEVLALLEAGYADKLLLSSDKRRGFVATPTVFVPKLRAAGVSDEVLHKILVDNPRRFLAIVPKTSRKRQS